jgi:hypothetical protein
MSINIKPRRETVSSNFTDEEKIAAKQAVLKNETVKISVDIDSNLYFQMMELKLNTKKIKKYSLKLKDIITIALKDYFEKIKKEQ